MTSTKLNFKNISTVFNQTLKSRMVPSVILFIISIISSIVAVVAMLTMALIPDESYYGFEKDILDTLLAVLAGIIILFSILNSVGMFSQIYKKQSCDHIFALPIKREELFIGKYLCGAIVNVICLIVPSVVYSIACIFINLKFSYLDGACVINAVLSVIAAYSAFMICAVISGKRSHALVLSILYFVCSSEFTVGIVKSINSVWGITLNSPVMNALTSSYLSTNSDNIKKDIIIYLAVNVIKIIVLFAVGIIAFKKRKAECAELELFSKYIACFVLAVVAGSTFFYLGLGTNYYELLFGVAGAAFITFIFCEFFFRKAFTKPAIITLCVTCLVCAGFATLEATHIVDKVIYYVPEVEDVESVSFYNVEIGNDPVGGIDVFEASVGFAYDYDDNDEYRYKLTEKKSIENAIALHKVSLTDKAKTAKRDSSAISGIKELIDMYELDVYEYEQYTLVYHLKNGRTVTRQYAAPLNAVQTELVAICRDDVVINDNLSESNYGDYLFASMDIGIGVEDSYKAEIKGFDKDKFFEAYKKDIKENDTAALSILGYSKDEYDDYDYETDEDDDFANAGITLRYINNDAIDTDGDKKLVEEIKKSSPEQIIKMDEENNRVYYLLSYSSYYITKDYPNTMAYLKTLGVEF